MEFSVENYISWVTYTFLGGARASMMDAVIDDNSYVSGSTPFPFAPKTFTTIQSWVVYMLMEHTTH